MNLATFNRTRFLQKIWKYVPLALYYVYLHLFYYILLLPAFAEFSFYAFLTIPLALAALWLVPKERRKLAGLLTLLFLFVEQAFGYIMNTKGWELYLSAFVITGFLYGLAYFYAKINPVHVLVIAVVAFYLQSVYPERTMLILAEFVPKQTVGSQYIGEFYGSLPFNVLDLDGDGRDEVILLGNRDYYPGDRPLPIGYRMYNEPLHVTVWEWRDGRMRRVPDERLDENLRNGDPFRLHEWLPNEYIGFPYYLINRDLEIEALVERVPFASGMLQFGTVPYRMLTLNMENVLALLQMSDGVFDRKAAAGELYRNLRIAGGELTGEYDGVPFAMPTTMTKIVGAVRMGDGSEGLLLKGYHVELVRIMDGQPVVTHILTRQMQKDLAYSPLRAADVDGDGVDEVIVDYPYANILKPLADGSWKLLWSSGVERLSTSFRVLDVSRSKDGGKPEIMALSKSLVRASHTNYLTGFTYTGKGLKQKWKIFLPNVDQAYYGDIDGNGKEEIIVKYRNSSMFSVFEKHHFPLTKIAIALTGLLLAGLIGRRLYDAFRKR